MKNFQKNANTDEVKLRKLMMNNDLSCTNEVIIQFIIAY